MKKRFFISLLALFAVANISFAQVLNPTKWSFSTKKVSDSEVELIFSLSLESGWHIYSQYTDPNGPLPMVFTFKESPNYKRIDKVVEPKVTKSFDDVFKVNVSYFSNKAVFKQKIKVLSTKDFKVEGHLEYQLCNEGSCIPPDEVPFSFSVKGVDASAISAEDPTKAVDTAVAATTTEADTPAVETAQQPEVKTAAVEVSSTKEAGESDSLLLAFFVAFGMGLLALITPCVFPMIPMTVSFFMKGGSNKKEGTKQALIFGLSIILIFAVLGLILTLIFGQDAMYIISTHWIPNVIFFLIFMFFAFSFFGLFDIKMPSWMINKSDEKADKGGLLGPFFIALTTVLVSFSCTGPILGSALIELSSGSSSRLVPLISMVGFAVGFALPFTLLALFPSAMSKMKSGSWLNTVKVVFGFIEVALALKFLSIADLSSNWGILSRETYLCLWIVIFAMLGFYLLGKMNFKGDSPLKEITVPRLFLSIITFAFVVYMIPGLWGAPLKALSGYVPPMTTQDFDMGRIVYESSRHGGGGSEKAGELPLDRKYADILHLPTGFEGFYDLEEAKAHAKKVNKPIFVDFTGKTCANCREMENNVWNAPQVQQLLSEKFVMVALYADANFISLPENEWITTAEGKVIKTLGKKNLNYQITKFNMNAQPYYVLMDANENLLTEQNKVYDKNVENFVKFLNEGLENFHKKK